MGLIDYGTQKITFDYKEEGTSQNFNKVNYKILPVGFYSGGDITITAVDKISIDPFIAVVQDDVNELAVRLETTTQITDFNVASALPYIVGRFTWSNTEDNYMDILSVAYADIDANDLVLCKLVFSGANAIAVDTSVKSWSPSYYANLNNSTSQFKVTATNPTYNNQVTVYPGNAIINGEIVTISVPTQSPTFTLPTSANGRKDVVYIDENGSIGILQGADTPGAPIPMLDNKYLPIALVTFPAAASVVRGDYITVLNPNIFFTSPPTETRHSYFILDKDNSGPRLKNSSGVLEFRNFADNDYVVTRCKNPIANNDSVNLGYLNSWAGSTAITTLGTIATGTWNATVIADNKIASVLTNKSYNGITPTVYATSFAISGGTIPKVLTVNNHFTLTSSGAGGGIEVTNEATLVFGASLSTVGGLLYTISQNSVATLADVAVGNVLLSQGSGVAPAYGKVALDTHISGILAGTNGGTGVNNGSKTITLGGNLTTSGAHTLTLTTTNNTSITLPTTGTLATLAGIETLSNKTLTTPKIVSGGSINDENGNEYLKFVSVASAVNEISITNTIATGTPSISATGNDTNISLNLISKGTGTVKINNVDAVDLSTAQTLTNKTMNSGTVWNGGIIAGTYGGTGVNNGSKTITLGGNFATSGAYGLTLTLTNTTGVTLPTTGTLSTLAGTETLSNKTLTTPKFADLGYIADASGNEMLVFDSVSSAVNYLQINNNATTFGPSIISEGSDTNISLSIKSKGTGKIFVNTIEVADISTVQTFTNKTLSTGSVWNGNTIGASYGGTGQSSYAIGDLLYASAATTISKLADIATGNALISGGIGVAPSYGKIGLTTHVSGILAGANGGTGIDNGTKTITLANNFITSGNYSLTLTTTASTNVTLPTTGTLATRAGSEALTNKTINGLTITSSTGTLTIAALKTLTVNNTLTLSGTDGSTLNIGTGGTLGTAAYKNTGTTGNTVPLLDGTNTWSGIQSFNNATSPFYVTSTNMITNLNSEMVGGYKSASLQKVSDEGLVGYWPFDEVPEISDNEAGTTYVNSNFTVTTSWSTPLGGTVSVANGELIYTRDAGAAGNRILRLTYAGIKQKTARIKIRASANCDISINNDSTSQVFSLIAGEDTICNTYLVGDTFDYLDIETITNPIVLNISFVYIGDGTYTSKALDASGNLNFGTINNMTPITGISGRGLSSDGTRGYISTPITMLSQTAFTLATWYKPSAVDGVDRFLISKNTARPWLRLASTNKFQVGSYTTGTTGGAIVEGTTTAQVNTNYFVVATHDGTTLKLYVNGVLESQSTQALNITDVAFLLGALSTSSGNIKGTLDEPRIYNRALSAEEVAGLYLQRGGAKAYTFAETPVPYSLPYRDSNGAISATNFISSSLTSGSVLFANASSQISQDNANLFWDNTNKRLGIGTATPRDMLDIRGTPVSATGVATGNLLDIVNTSTLFDANPIAGLSFWNRYTTAGSVFPSGAIQAGKENATNGNYAGYLAFCTLVNGGSFGERMRITSTGLVGINTTTPSSSFGGLDIASGGLSLVMGANASSSTRTDSTDKASRIGSYHYTNAEEPIGICSVSSTSIASTIDFGGGSSLLNAATVLRFFTATNNTTTTGTERMRMDSAGNVGIGTTDLDETPAIGRLTVKGTTTDGTTNIFVGRDSAEANVFSINTDGVVTLTSIELGHASDTTITRASAGVVNIEGVPIVTTTATQTLTNKTLTSPTLTTPNIERAFTAGENLVAGNLCYLKSDGKMWKVSNAAEATSTGLLALATGAISAEASGTFRLAGYYTTSGLTTGAIQYVGTAGAITGTIPATSGNVVRIVGYAISTTVLYLNPSNDYLVLV